MEKVKFETDKDMTFIKRTYEKKEGGMVSWLIRRGIAKSESEANQYLLGIFAFNILLSLFIIYYFTF